MILPRSSPYVCADSDLAKGHLESIRRRLESSEVGHYYPGLANPRLSRGVQTAWRQDRLVTASWWGIIPLGLKEGVRGSRLDAVLDEFGATVGEHREDDGQGVAGAGVYEEAACARTHTPRVGGGAGVALRGITGEVH